MAGSKPQLGSPKSSRARKLLDKIRRMVGSSVPVTIVFGVASGLVFGFALERGQVFDAAVIRDQMTMTRFTMLRMFLSAMATSCVVITGLRTFDLVTLTDLNPIWKRNAIGAGLLGVGMYIAGACPGTVFAQLGASALSQPVLLTLLAGGLFGAWLFGRVEPQVRAALPSHSNADLATLPKVLGAPFWAVSVPMVAAVAAGLYALEQYRPWQVDSYVPLSTSISPAMLWQPVWAPHFAGAVIGVLQLPVFLLTSNGLGASSAFVTMATALASPFDSKIKDRPYFKDYLWTPKNAWQPSAVVGIIAGAFLSSWTAGRVMAAPIIGHKLAFVSGLLLVFGARMANGCTSGHGLTGSGKLNVGSLIAAASMFAGAIATAWLLPPRALFW
eukprot:TRINITY_DN27858_c0_g1_i1.p1 TRINITY_DN27858_c0_g1~~TRINITY_DN27858_c0_g1_i1.p1  ORF type:complete len:418 (-),score=138.53 TRINITY_DN27858_c0_g1_i1:505-1662(-)